MNELLPPLRLVLDSAMVMLIWLVQLVIYPAFRAFEAAGFVRAHAGYMRTISFIVIPLMLAQAATIALQLAAGVSASTVVSAVAVGIAWGSTFLFSVPCHRALQEHGRTADRVARLVQTNWVRTIAWTVAFIAGALS